MTISTLREGMRSAAVKQLQQQLDKVGTFNGPTTGYYGPITKGAVAAFERSHGLRADGIADPVTRAAIAKAATPSVVLKEGMTGARVTKLQAQLQRLGFFHQAPTGYFGPITRAAVMAFEKKIGVRVDGNAGARVQAELAKRVAALPPAPTPSWQNVAPPPNDYRVVSFRGVKVDVRTRVMIQRAESYMHKLGVAGTLSFAQGSFSSGVAASAGTHDGGGALDVSIRNYSSATADKVVKAMRMAGFAAWRRGVNDTFSPHIHAIAIGDRLATPVAKAQVAEYFRGGDGLVGSRGDIHLTSVGHNIGRPVPNWAR